MTDLELLAALINKSDPGKNVTTEELKANGFEYWLTELTDSEARSLGARAYLKRRAAVDE